MAPTLIRFALVGLANTGASLAVILGLQFGFAVNPQLANAAGYGVGFALSFALNRRFVFARGASVRRAAPRFALAAAAAFGVNQLVLALARRVLGPGDVGAAAAQVTAMACYTALFFVLCRYWAFASGAPAGARS
jgi:putative flippase GtrA